jgi:excisionase family DNA binding protein
VLSLLDKFLDYWDRFEYGNRDQTRNVEAVPGVKPANQRQAKRFVREPELISVKAAQALLGDVSDKTVRRLVKTGRIEAVKVGTRLLPRLASVRSFARGE